MPRCALMPMSGRFVLVLTLEVQQGRARVRLPKMSDPLQVPYRRRLPLDESRLDLQPNGCCLGAVMPGQPFGIDAGHDWGSRLHEPASASALHTHRRPPVHGAIWTLKRSVRKFAERGFTFTHAETVAREMPGSATIR